MERAAYSGEDTQPSPRASVQEPAPNLEQLSYLSNSSVFVWPRAYRNMAEMRAGFGEGLRFERERRGVSLASLSAQTKVNPRHLEALEQGDYKVLPGGVFRRGIVRAYLASVGLDEREWMPRFQASYEAQARELGTATASGQEEWATFAVNVKRSRTRPRPKMAWRWLGVLALFLLVLAAAWAIWHFLLRARLG